MRPTILRAGTFVLLSLLMSACTLRYTQGSYSDPALADAATSLAVEGGIYFWNGRLLGQRADFGLIGSYQEFDFFTDAAATHGQARVRWFPLEQGLFDPFAGGGLGIYRLARTANDRRCGTGICLADQFDEREQAAGLMPHVVFGTEIRPGSAPGALVLAVAREFNAFDEQWDVGAWRFSAGFVYRPR